MKSTKRTVIRLIIIVLSLVITARLGKQTYELLKVRGRLTETESKVTTLEAETRQLEQELEYKKSSAYVEKQIRDKLRLSRPEDITIDVGIYPGNSAKDEDEHTQKSGEVVPIWRQWWLLFAPQITIENSS